LVKTLLGWRIAAVRMAAAHAICGMSVRVSLGKPRARGLLHGCDCPALWRDVTDLGVTHLPCGHGGVGDPETDDPEIDFGQGGRQ
jgi:hypothetical protein